MRKLSEHLLALRSLLGIPCFTMVAAAMVFLLAFFEQRGGRRSYNLIVRPWSRLMLWLGGVKLSVNSATELNEDSGPYIVVFNHQSHFDVPTLVASLPLQARFVGKDSLGRIPVFGHAARKVGCVFIDRHDAGDSRSGLAAAAETLKSTGMSIVIAPEGTRSNGREMLPFRKGAFVMAIELGVPILPLTISGTSEILPRKSLYTHAGRVSVDILPPVPVTGLNYQDRDRLSQKTREAMENSLAARLKT